MMVFMLNDGKLQRRREKRSALFGVYHFWGMRWSYFARLATIMFWILE